MNIYLTQLKSNAVEHNTEQINIVDYDMFRIKFVKSRVSNMVVQFHLPIN